MSIVPICLYKNQGEPGGFLDYPVKTKDGFVCREKQDMIKVATLYSVSPDFRPIPEGMSLFCIGNGKVDFIYDMFDIDQNCKRFFGWTRPIPHGVPVYIADNGVGTLVSLEPFPERYRPVPYSPIYLLDTPDIGFKNLEGLCVPTRNGYNLYRCMEEDSHSDSILERLREEEKSNIVTRIILKILGIILIIILLQKIKENYARNSR
jgi:hypothetical protein